MVSKNSPQLPVLQKCVEMLESEIAAQKSKLTGGDSSLSEKTAGYSQLVMKNVFAEKQLATALSSLEQARTDAVRKQLYLERIAQPDKPDKAMEPRRFIDVFATFVISMILWGILTMLIAGVREHHD
jgi:capsular polysaccharide transport system permease protein